MNSLEILSSIGGCFHQIALSYGLPLSLLLAGALGSVTHCTVMCGPFVVSQTGDLDKLRDVALIPYHLGRMTTYMLLSVLAYSVFSVVFVYSDLKSVIAAPMLLLAGTIFLVSAFPKMQVLFPWVRFLQFPLSFFGRLSYKAGQGGTFWSRYGLGVLLGFMPCGLVVAALLASVTAPTLIMAILSMGAFTIGTIPTLVLIGIGGSHLKQTYPKFSLRFSQRAKVISAFWLFALAGNLIL